MKWNVVAQIIAGVLALAGGPCRGASAQQPKLPLAPKMSLEQQDVKALELTRERSSWSNRCYPASFTGCTISEPVSHFRENLTTDFMHKQLRALDEFANPEKYSSDGTPTLRVLPALIGPSYGIAAKAVF